MGGVSNLLNLLKKNWVLYDYQEGTEKWAMGSGKFLGMDPFWEKRDEKESGDAWLEYTAIWETVHE